MTRTKPINREDAALLGRLLLWRVLEAAPDDVPSDDVGARLRLAGASFRQTTRPLTAEEVEGAVRRLEDASD